MARPPSSKGSDRGKSGANGAESTKNSRMSRRMRAEMIESAAPEPFPKPVTRFGSESPENHGWGSDDALEGVGGAGEIQSALTVPKSWLKFIIGLFLTPLAWVLTLTFLQTFTSSFHQGLLANASAGYFAGGVVLFGFLCLVVPQRVLMFPYVLGHEVTHAIWVKLFGGKVADHFHVSLEGGHVLSDRVNTWIALAPYFFPIYSVLVVTLYGAASLVTNMSPCRPVLFLLLGATMAFHLTFTFLLIVRGQPDLHYGGTFFSLMVIYLLNLFILTCLLLVFDIALTEDAAKHHKLYEVSWLATLETFGGLFIKNCLGFIDFCIALTGWIATWIQNMTADFGH
jgi:hypothetical protein